MPVIAFAALILTATAVNAIFGGGYFENHNWPPFLGAVLAGAAVWLLGRRLNGRPGRTMIDRQTGEEVELKNKHDLFFIPMEYWGPILVLLAVLLAL